jgi:hypothetical protein
MTCGHISAEAKRTDTFERNVIHSMLADYQGRANGGGGSMRVWDFYLATIESAPNTVTTTYDGLKPGTAYEWYATVKDCANTVSSPIYRFTTKP